MTLALLLCRSEGGSVPFSWALFLGLKGRVVPGQNGFASTFSKTKLTTKNILLEMYKQEKGKILIIFQ